MAESICSKTWLLERCSMGWPMRIVLRLHETDEKKRRAFVNEAANCRPIKDATPRSFRGAHHAPLGRMIALGAVTECKRQYCFRTVKAAFFFVSTLENIAQLRAFSFSVRARLWCHSSINRFFTSTYRTAPDDLLL
jgi:hypothetical protein